MAFKRLETKSLTELFVEEIKEMILSGELSIGEKLPSERQMADEMHVSLAVVNAGITRLVNYGFLRAVPREGNYVEDYLRNGNIDTFLALLNFSDGKTDPGMLEFILTMKDTIETTLFKATCLNRTEEDLVRLTAVANAIGACRDYDRASELGYEFVHELAFSSGNPYYSMMTQSFRNIYIAFHKLSYENGISNAEEIMHIRLALVEAIRNRDVSEAVRITKAETTEWEERMQRLSA